MTIAVHYTEDAAEALARAGSFLEHRPAEHNLVLTILHDRVATLEPGRYWWVTENGAVVGVALQSPTNFTATITPLVGPALGAIVEGIASQVSDLPGINGEAATAAAFAGQWAEIRRQPASPVEATRLYQLGALREPRGSSGMARLATGTDRHLVREWLEGFVADTGPHHPPSGRVAAVDARITNQRLWIWEDGEPVSMVGFTRTVAGVARIGPVYTPPEHRRHGYATACTAAVSAHVLAEHADGCVLYTALANPTSNAIYRSIGYEPVYEVLRYEFG